MVRPGGGGCSPEQHLWERVLGLRTKASANPPGCSDVRTAFWIIHLERRPLNSPTDLSLDAGCLGVGVGTWPWWPGESDSAEPSAIKSWKNGCVGLRGGEAVWEVLVSWPLLLPGLLSHTKRLMLEVWNRWVISWDVASCIHAFSCLVNYGMEMGAGKMVPRMPTWLQQHTNSSNPKAPHIGHFICIPGIFS